MELDPVTPLTIPRFGGPSATRLTRRAEPRYILRPRESVLSRCRLSLLLRVCRMSVRVYQADAVR